MLRLLGKDVLGYTALDEPVRPLAGIARLGDDDTILPLDPERVRLVNAIGSVGADTKRRALFERMKTLGFSFETLVHPEACVAADIEIGEGVQIMARAVVQTGTHIGSNTIVNTAAIIDHDCVIGSHCHIAPGVTLSGGVTLASGVHVGTGASVIQGVNLGAGAVVGCGAAVIKHVDAKTIVGGVPAKLLRNLRED
jgi:UDP-perosamine 4-acetyltransferase